MNLRLLKRKIGIELPDAELEEILYHASYQPQEPDLRKKNKNYVAWGTSIINSAYAIFEYRSDRELKVKEFSTQINMIRDVVWKKAYEQYDLEEFVLKSSGEIGNKHPEIVSKLVTLIYLHCGFIRAYDFLSPFFGNNESVIDYKTLIQEYAQSFKLTPNYTLVDETGPDHDKKYICKVSVGSRSALGEGGSKKKAEKAAAEKFAKTFKIPFQREKSIGNRKKSVSVGISDQRKQELQDAIKLLRIKSRYVSSSQINEAFTHKSFINDHKNLRLNSNDCLSITGANILQMLCNDYILSKHGSSNVSFVRERSTLVDEKNIIKAIPDSAVRYLLTSNNLFENTSARAMNSLKVDVLKSLLAILWINYCKAGEEEMRDYAINYAFKIFEQAEEYKLEDYRTLLQEVTQQYDFTVEESCELLPGVPDNSPAFYATLKVKAIDWEIEAGGYGNAKKAAKNNASKSALIQILPHIQDKDVFDRIRKTVNIAVEDILMREE